MVIGIATHVVKIDGGHLASTSNSMMHKKDDRTLQIAGASSFFGKFSRNLQEEVAANAGGAVPNAFTSFDSLCSASS